MNVVLVRRLEGGLGEHQWRRESWIQLQRKYETIHSQIDKNEVCQLKVTALNQVDLYSTW